MESNKMRRDLYLIELTKDSFKNDYLSIIKIFLSLLLQPTGETAVLESEWVKICFNRAYSLIIF